MMHKSETTEFAKCEKQKLIQPEREINKSTIIVGGFDTSLLPIDKARQKINKDTEELNDTISQQDSINIYKTL